MTEWGRQWEKLVNLMRDEAIEIQNVGGEGYYLVSPTKLADRLLANGVTVQPVTEKRTGLYGKYSIFRADGTPVKDRCFVLKPDKDPVAVKALQTYAAATDDEQLRNDLYDWVGKPMPLPEPPKEES